MKKSFILRISIITVFSLTLMLTQNLYANGKPDTKKIVTENTVYVSRTVENSFVAEFGDQPNPMWKSTTNFDVASFEKDGQNINAYFTKEGVLEGWTLLRKWNDLPLQAQENILQRYSDYDVKHVFAYFGNSSSAFGNHFVTLSKGNKRIIVQVNENWDTTLYKKL
jgi:hypothetical protein